jgi:hypothetical protein
MPQFSDARAVCWAADAFQFCHRCAATAGDLGAVQALDLTTASCDHVIQDLCTLRLSQCDIEILLKMHDIKC